MKRIPTIVATLAVGTAFAVAPALAASGGVARSTSKETQTTGSGTMAPAAGSKDMNKAERGTNKDSEAGSGSAMMSASQLQDLKTGDVSTVKVVSANDMANSDTSTSDSMATNTTAAEQQKIQSALQSNPDVMKQLKAQSVEVSSVVAANYDGNGTLTVFTR